jgi:hypothetical protein
MTCHRRDRIGAPLRAAARPGARLDRWVRDELDGDARALPLAARNAPALALVAHDRVRATLEVQDLDHLLAQGGQRELSLSLSLCLSVSLSLCLSVSLSLCLSVSLSLCLSRARAPRVDGQPPRRRAPPLPAPRKKRRG